MATKAEVMSDQKITLEFTRADLAAIIETADLSNDSVSGWIYTKIMNATVTNDEHRFAIRRTLLADMPE